MNTTLLGVTALPPHWWILVIVGLVIPAVSAALVKAHWDGSITGLLTLALSAVSGFLTEFAHHGPNYSLRQAILASVLALALAAFSQGRILSGTQVEAFLLSLRSDSPRSDTPSAIDGIAEYAHQDPTETLAYEDPSPAPATAEGGSAAPVPASAPAQPEPAVPATPAAL